MPFLSPSALAIAMPSVMPMSANVWCASICRSPLAFTSRSSAPWRASWSSMWSMNGIPEARRASPRPSRSTLTLTWVSLVSRWISALRMMSAEGLGECLEHSRVLVGSSDREPQAVGEQGMRAVECAHQYTTLPQRLERERRIGHARQDEVRRRGEGGHPPQGGERAFQPGALGDDRRGLALENLAALDEHLGRRGREAVHVVGHAQLLELVEPRRGADRHPQAQHREAQLRNGANEQQVGMPAHFAQQARPGGE